MALGKPPRREIFNSSRHTLLRKLDKRGFSVPPTFSAFFDGFICVAAATSWA